MATRKTTAQWNNENPILAMDELGVETDNGNATKVGDGVTAWNDLPYVVGDSTQNELIDSLTTRVETLENSGGGGGGGTIPTKTSQLENDSGFITSDAVPTKTSQLTNDSGFLTQHQDISGKADKSEIPTKTSQLTNDSGFLVKLADGVTKVGQYLDFHVNGTNTDYSDRLHTTGGTLNASGDFKAGGSITDGSGNVLSNKADKSSLPSLSVHAFDISGTAISSQNGTKSLTVNVANSSYGTPLAVVGFNLTGTNNYYLTVYRAYLNGTTATVNVRNDRSGSVTPSGKVYVLYVKNNG